MEFIGIKDTQDLLKIAQQNKLKSAHRTNISNSLRKKIIEFFKKNPHPQDEKQIHALAEKWGVNKHKLEEAIYAILGEYISVSK